MSIAAAQYDNFKEQVVNEGCVFTFTDNGEYVVFKPESGETVPFWSSRSRLETIQERFPKYRGATNHRAALRRILEGAGSAGRREGQGRRQLARQESQRVQCDGRPAPCRTPVLHREIREATSPELGYLTTMGAGNIDNRSRATIA